MPPRRRKPRYHIVMTSGPTREFLDSVRFISNPSSGKMGDALARAAVARGHQVTLVCGPVCLKDPPGATVVRVTTGAEMLAAAKAAYADADAAIFAAAVCDYRPEKRAAKKLPKQQGRSVIELRPTPDIAATLGRIKQHRVNIAFALEDHDGRRKAEAKLKKKRADAIVLNGPDNLHAGEALVEFLRKGDDWQSWPAGSKRRIAGRIIAQLESMLADAEH